MGNEQHPSTSVLLDTLVSTDMPTPWATFKLLSFDLGEVGREHFALVLGDVAHVEPVLCRIHSECLTGEALHSLRCDCGPQLDLALQKIAESGCGVLIYLRQEGRGIGLRNKIRAYALQDKGMDTIEANEALGLGVDLRNFDVAGLMLKTLGVGTVKLMTNNPDNLSCLAQHGIAIAERIPLKIEANPFNQAYLSTKARRLGHFLNDET